MTNLSIVDEYHQAAITETFQIFPIGLGFGRQEEVEEPEDEVVETKVVRQPTERPAKANESVETKTEK